MTKPASRSNMSKSAQTPIHRAATKQRDFRNFFPKFCFWAVISITSIVLAWILFLRIKEGLLFDNPKQLLIIFVLLCLIIFCYAYHRRYPIKLFQSQKFWRLVLIFSIVLGISLRLLFLAFFDEFAPTGLTSDTGVHYNAAQEILNTGAIASSEIGIYESYHTQLMSYNYVTVLAQWLFGANYLSVLIPNIIFDLIASLVLFILLRKWQNERTAAIGVAFYLLNPLGISFCAQALALSIVNMFIIIGLFMVYEFWQSLRKEHYRKFLLLAAASGLVFAISNSLRPVFSVFIIAVIILLAVHTISKLQKRTTLYTIGGAALLLVTFITGGTLIDLSYQLINPYYQDTGHGALGWNLFVGANFDSKGRWSYEDWDLMPPRLFGGEMTPTEINEDFTKMALRRYKEMGIRKLGIHLINKTEMIFTSNEVTPIRNLEEQFKTVNGREEWYQTLNNSFMLSLTILIGLSSIYFWRLIQNRSAKPDFFIFFLALCFCGLFFSSLLVEVMSRYVSIFVPLLIIFSAAALNNSRPAKVNS